MTKTASFMMSNYGRLAIPFTVLLLLSACVSSPNKPSEQGDYSEIYFVENKSVDLAVRKDFEAAIELLQAGEYKKAIGLLEKVKKGSQKNSAPYINIAMAYEKIGDFEQAEENLKQALEINPDHPVANNEYALLYRKTGRYAEARQLYEKLLERYPEFMPARKNFGILCELYLDDAPCALAQYESYFQANPDDEAVKLWIATLKQRVGN